MVDYLNLLAAALHVLVGAFVAYEILRLGRRAPRTAGALVAFFLLAGAALLNDPDPLLGYDPLLAGVPDVAVAVRLHPAVIVIVAAAGAAVAGIVGLLLAPPVAGVVRAALETFYRESWLDPPPPPGPEAERERTATGSDGALDEPG